MFNLKEISRSVHTAGKRTAWLLVLFAAVNTATAHAQLFPSAWFGPAVLDVKPEEVRPEPSAALSATAQQAFERGDIVRIIGGTPSDFQRLLGVKVATAKTSKAVDGAQVIAVRKVSQFFRQFTASLADPVAPRTRKWQDLFERWRASEKARPDAVGDPSAPTEAWTLINESEYILAEVTEQVSVYRLNTKQVLHDYYMVILDSTVEPDYVYCYAVLVGDCGFWTNLRTVELSAGAGSGLIEHGPTGTITSETVSFSVGGTLTPAGPGASASFGVSWTQPSVTTTDLSSNTIAKWQENFVGRNAASVPPITSRSTFLSHQGAIFEVGFGQSFDLSLNATATLWYEDAFQSFSDGAPETPSVNVKIPINPPLLALSPKSITIAPGESRSVSVTATIPGSAQGLAWQLTYSPAQGIAISQTTGANNTTLVLTVEPGVAISTVWNLNLQTSPPYGTPAVAQNPLQLTVTAGAAPPLAREGILLTGGESGGVPTAAAEAYDSINNSMVEVGNLLIARTSHTATALTDGKVLIAGGTTIVNAKTVATATAELYDPDTQKFSTVQGATQCPGVAGCMNIARYEHSATMLPSGKVLFVGGLVNNADPNTATATAEIYDPATGTFTATGELREARAGHSAAWIPTLGKVLVSGGFYYASGINREPLITSEYYDPGTGLFTPASNLPHSALGMAGVQTGVCYFCLTGGTFNFENTSESYYWYFDPSTGLWAAGPPLNTSRLGHTVTAMTSTEILVVGGYTQSPGKDRQTLSTAETYVLGSDAWANTNANSACPGATGCLVSARSMHSASLLADGRVLLAGGRGDSPLALGTTEFYDPSTRTFTSGPALLIPRSKHTATPFKASNLVTTTALESGHNPSSYDQSVTLVATVTSPAGGTATGTMTFIDGTTTLGKVDMSAGSAAFVTSTLRAGTHSITTVYGGSSTYASSTSTALIQTVNQNAPTVSIASSPNPSKSGQPVSFTASVKSPDGVPQGLVEFLEETVLLGSVVLQDGVAVYNTGTLTPGLHVISAKYDGDGNFKSALSAAVSQNVVIASTTTLTASVNPSTPDQSVVFTATVSAASGTPSGTVDFYSDKKLLKADVPLSGGRAQYTKKQFAAGTHSVTAAYQPDPNSIYAGSSSSTLTQSVLNVTTTVLTSSANPANPGQSLIFRANVTAAKGSPAGTVDFLDGTTVLAANVAMTNGAARYSTTTLTQGAHSVTAIFQPADSTNFSSSTSTALKETVLAASTTVLSSSLNPSSHGQPITLTATVSGPGGTPSGTVTFTDGGKALGQAALSGGKAVYSTSSLENGVHSIAATYGGDSSFSSGKSTALTQTVNPGGATVTLQSSKTPSNQGQSVSFTATVKGPEGTTPSGNVIFMDGAVSMGYATISQSIAVFPTSTLSSGTHIITALYRGDNNFGQATSAPVTQVVQPAATATTTVLISSPNPSTAGQPVQFTATVVASTGTAIPTGNVQFFDNNTTSLGTVPLNKGQAELSVSSLAASAHSITAVFASNGNFGGSTSRAYTQTVQAGACAPSTLTITAAPTPSTLGQTVMFTVVAAWTGTGTPTGNVNISETLPNNGGSKTWATGDLVSGQIILPVNGLALGTHRMYATYGGDPATNHCGATSSSLDQVVNAPASQ